MKKENRYAMFEAILRREAKLCRWPDPVTEFKFHPVRKWRSDFAFPESLLLIEIEGGFWVAGRHSRGGGGIKDMEKYNEASILGYRILRFTPQQTNSMFAIEVIKRWFDNKRKD